MNPIPTLLLAAVALSGCATLNGTPTQPVSIHAVDAFDRPVEGMRCRISNSAAEYLGSTPMFDLQVRRSASDLQIECRRGDAVARGTAISRGDSLAAAILPGGTAAIVVDHLTGYRYAYAPTLRLRVGAHLVFDPKAPPPAAAPVTLALDAHR